MRLEISREVLASIRRDAAAAHPLEACGLLFGDEGAIDDCETTANVADDPRHRFEIDPEPLFAALRAERSGGPRLAGYWHSHPSGTGTPSSTDAAMAAADGRIWLIVGSEIAAWRAVEGGELLNRFDRVSIDILHS